MKYQTLKAISAIYMILACFFLLLADNIAFGIMVVVCLMGAWGYNESANEEWETILSNLYEGTGND